MLIDLEGTLENIIFTQAPHVQKGKQRHKWGKVSCSKSHKYQGSCYLSKVDHSPAQATQI